MTHSRPQAARSLDLALDLAAALLAHMGLDRYPVVKMSKGRWVKRTGERLDALPYIVRGRLDAVLQLGEEGMQVIPVTFGPGEIALLSALFSGEPIHGEFLASEDLQIRWLPIHDLESLLQLEPGLLLLLVKFLSQRLREVRARERGWLERGVHERVCAGLARVALEVMPGTSDQPWTVRITHERLALRCGVSRPKLSLTLKQLESAGAIRLSRGRVELLDYAALTARR
ncbi:Crp/Fnr family transcriptional regulator [Ottowia sp. VDI28]|uniref:Crp/Fnr family transcriptional regulator n=1 Tax=Ottowia sp. VDI28 TaxID=3133968 RepID=UPI003C2F12D9